MSTTIFTDDVRIEGSADETQLSIQGSSGQTAPLQSWEDDASTQLARITSDGRFQNGDMSVSTPDALIEAHRDSGSSLPKRGFHSLGRIASALSDAVSWLVTELELIGTGTISGLHRVVRAKLLHSSTGNSSSAELRAGDLEVINQGGSSLNPVGKAVGLQVGVDNQNGAYLNQATGLSSLIQNGTGADLQTAKGLEVQAVSNNGLIDMLIGLDIADMDEGTDNYAIRTGAGKVQFGELAAGLLKADSNGLLDNAVKGTDFDVPMQGATASSNGLAGVVPQPMAGDEDKFLRGDGNWADGSIVAALNDLVDVNTAGATEDQVLTYNGSQWVAQATANILPTGVMMPFIGNGAEPPVGWLYCNGQSLDVSNYAGLHSYLGYGQKRMASLSARTGDSDGTVDLLYSEHGFLAASASLKLHFIPSAVQISSLNTTTDVITTSANHNLETGDRVRVSSTGTLPGGLVVGTNYYVRKNSATELKLHPTASDATNNTNTINLTSAGTGTHTLIPQDTVFRSGMSIDSVSATTIVLSGGTGRVLPAVGSSITVECVSGRFFLLDMGGRVPVGAGQAPGLTNRILHSSFGEEEHQLTLSELAAHNHNRNPAGSSESVLVGGSSGGIRGFDAGTNQTTGGVLTGNTGSNVAHNNMQPSFVVNYIIKI